jgi:hypothetical protein
MPPLQIFMPASRMREGVESLLKLRVEMIS